MTRREPTSVRDAGSIPMPRRRWLLRFALPAMLVVAVGALVAIATRDSLGTRASVEAVPVAIRQVEVDGPAARGASIVVAPGWIEADPSTHRIAALADGVVETVLVLEGDAIVVNQPVATLVAEDARIALARAEAEVSRRTAMRDDALARLDAASTELDTLVGPRRRESIARADAARLEAAAAAATLFADAADSKHRELADELERLESLAERGGASEGAVARLRLRLATSASEASARKQEAEAARSAAAAATAEQVAAARHLELLVAETLAAESARASLDAAEAELRLAIAAREEASLRLDRMTVRSPIDGIVIERLAVPGTRLGGEITAIAEAYDPRHLQVRVDVPLAEAARIGVGQPAEITLDLLPDRVFAGVVTRLVHRADLAKNTVPVKVRIEDPDARLKPDMLARVRFLPAERDGAARRVVTRIFAPEAAIRIESDGGASTTAIASVVEGRGIAETRRVELGPAAIAGWREVIDGLRAGEWVVTGEPPRDGARVEVIEPDRVVANKEAPR